MSFIIHLFDSCIWELKLSLKTDISSTTTTLKTGKALGPDDIPSRFLKEFTDELASVLCRLFRLIFISCTYPSSWKHALVQPVP